MSDDLVERLENFASSLDEDAEDERERLTRDPDCPDTMIRLIIAQERAALLREAAAAIEARDAEIARLKEALRPFARDGLSDHAGDIADLWLLRETAPVKLLRQSPSLKGWNFDKEIIPAITVGDLRRAASLLREIEQNPPAQSDGSEP